jgi:hypothetical protein
MYFAALNNKKSIIILTWYRIEPHALGLVPESSEERIETKLQTHLRKDL